MKNFEEFCESVKESVANKLNKNQHVILNDVTKNNGLILTGLTIYDNGTNTSPTIYLNKFYEQYKAGSYIGDIASEVIEIYRQNKVNKTFNLENFTNFEVVKEKIIFKLISYEKNVKFLKEVPHIKYLDFAIIFQILVSKEEYCTATITIKNEHANIWQVTTEELYKLAKINTPKLLPYSIRNMNDIITEMIDIEYTDTSNELPMYVLSNTMNSNGAICILYPEILKDFSTAIGKDIYILPSSVHESILLPCPVINNTDDIKELKEMVTEINRTQVEPDEVLTDSVYLYRKDTEKLEKVA